MIAALTEQAKERGIPVMVVTGDRDAYQLVDDGVRIMSTSRGVTDTKVYDREGVIDRYGIPPELIPDFIGLKGDTSRQHPRRPRHRRQDRRRPAPAFGDLEGVLGHVDDITRRQAQAEPRRARRQRAHVQAAGDDGPRRPDRHRPRGRVHHGRPTAATCAQIFRDWELRDPLRRLEEALEAAELDAIPRPEDVERIEVTTDPPARRATPPACTGDELALIVFPPEIPEGELIPREQKWRFAAYAGGNRALAGEVDDPAEVVAAAGDRPVVAHDAKALGEVPRQPGLRHRGRRLPARPRPPRLPARGARRGARHRRRRRATPSPPRRCSSTRSPPGSAPQIARARPGAAAARDRAAARPRAEGDREGGDQARHPPAGDRGEPDPAPTWSRSSARSGSWRTRSS